MTATCSYFMNPETYELEPVDSSVLSDNFKFVKENMECTIYSYKGKVFNVEPPFFVELEVTETDPGFAGNTATNATKPATVETGAEIKVASVHRAGREDQDRHPHGRVSVQSVIQVYKRGRSAVFPRIFSKEVFKMTVVEKAAYLKGLTEGSGHRSGFQGRQAVERAQ